MNSPSCGKGDDELPDLRERNQRMLERHGTTSSVTDEAPRPTRCVRALGTALLDRDRRLPRVGRCPPLSRPRALEPYFAAGTDSRRMPPAGLRR